MADLTIVMFWNRFGVPSGANGAVTGTQEEFALAVKRYEEFRALQGPKTNRPLLYVYFREQTEPESEDAIRVREFRKSIEQGRQLLYRQYAQVEEWEELLTEHLVAFLNGRMRTDLEKAVGHLAPTNSVMRGSFYWQAMYDPGTVLRTSFDFDGDDEEEEVTFRFQQTRHWLTFQKQSAGSEIYINNDFLEFLEHSSHIHLAVKDVNNDGISELLIASASGDLTAMLGVYGMKDGHFQEIKILSGQERIYVLEHGHIVMPYGSVGLSWSFVWRDGDFQAEEIYDPLRRHAAF